MKKNIKISVFVCFLLLISAIAFNFDEVRRLYQLNFLYSEDTIIENFRNMDAYFPTKEVQTLNPSPLPVDEYPKTLPKSFAYKGQNISTDYFMRYTGTTSLIVLQDGNIVFEQYFLDETQQDLHISWSVAKSFVSALIGIALNENKISSITDSIDSYLPELKGSAYEGVKIVDLLEMASGIAFYEDYGNPFSDVNQFSYTFALGLPMDKYIARQKKRAHEPGSFNNYASLDTQVLAMLLVKVTGKGLNEYLQEKIWQPLGMEYDAYWITDSSGMELAMGGLNASARDYAKFGQLYLNKGLWNGRQIVPSEWVAESVKTDKPHKQVGKSEFSSDDWGYGYQWWIAPDSDGDYMAIGVYNEFIFIDPKHNIVIVKLSGNAHYVEDDYVSEDKSPAFFRAISKHMTTQAAEKVR
jgi:CubicO group peptidase (beta-lactamase class C family)